VKLEVRLAIHLSTRISSIYQKYLHQVGLEDLNQIVSITTQDFIPQAVVELAFTTQSTYNFQSFQFLVTAT
jgi:hypothetical protein